MTLARDFQRSLKLTEVEEYVDLVLYRPVGFLLARGLSFTPITPNQVTFLSLAAGLSLRGTYRALQGLWFPPSRAGSTEDPLLYRRNNRPAVSAWTLLGQSTNRTLLAIGCFLLRPDLFLWTVILAGNAHPAAMILWQTRLRKQHDRRLVTMEQSKGGCP